MDKAEEMIQEKQNCNVAEGLLHLGTIFFYFLLSIIGSHQNYLYTEEQIGRPTLFNLYFKSMILASV